MVYGKRMLYNRVFNSTVTIALFLESISAIGKIPKDSGAFNDINRDSVFASYQYRDLTGYAAASILLIDNKNFYYKDGTDLEEYFSSGMWKIKKDTLILTSHFDRNNIPVSVTEYSSDFTDSVDIKWVRNINGDIVKDATIYFNGDSSKNSCMPVFSNCKRNKGVIGKIKIVFNNCSTSWYELKNEFASQIEPVLKLDFVLDKYVFMEEKRYLIREQGLYELQEKEIFTNGEKRIVLTKVNSRFFKKIKL